MDKLMVEAVKQALKVFAGGPSPDTIAKAALKVLKVAAKALR